MRLPGWMIFLQQRPTQREAGKHEPMNLQPQSHFQLCDHWNTSWTDREEVRLKRAARQQSGDTVYSQGKRPWVGPLQICQQGWNSIDFGYRWWHWTSPELYQSNKTTTVGSAKHLSALKDFLLTPPYDPECRPPSTQLTNQTKQVATALHMPAQLDGQGSCTASTPLTLKRVLLCASCITLPLQSSNACCTGEGHS